MGSLQPCRRFTPLKKIFRTHILSALTINEMNGVMVSVQNIEEKLDLSIFLKVKTSYKCVYQKGYPMTHQDFNLWDAFVFSVITCSSRLFNLRV